MPLDRKVWDGMQLQSLESQLGQSRGRLGAPPPPSPHSPHQNGTARRGHDLDLCLLEFEWFWKMDFIAAHFRSLSPHLQMEPHPPH